MLVAVVLLVSPFLRSILTWSQGEPACPRMHPLGGSPHAMTGLWRMVKDQVLLSESGQLSRAIPAPELSVELAESCLNNQLALQFNSPSAQFYFLCSLTGEVPKNTAPSPLLPTQTSCCQILESQNLFLREFCL